MFCKNCGQELANDAEFCHKCGTSVNAKNIVSKSSTNKFSKLVTAMMIADNIALLVIAVFMTVLFVNVTELSDKIDIGGSLEVSVLSDERSENEGDDDKGNENDNDDSFAYYDDTANDRYYYEDESEYGNEYNSGWYDEGPENVSQINTNNFLGTWSYTSYKTEKTVTFYSDGTFSGSIPMAFLERSLSTYYTLNNGDWSFLEQEQVLSVRDIMYSFSPSKLPVEMSGDTLTIYFSEIGDDSCVLTKVK